MTTELTANLDEPCYSVRDFLAVLAACRQERQPINVAIDRLLDMVADG